MMHKVAGIIQKGEVPGLEVAEFPDNTPISEIMQWAARRLADDKMNEPYYYWPTINVTVVPVQEPRTKKNEEDKNEVGID